MLKPEHTIPKSNIVLTVLSGFGGRSLKRELPNHLDQIRTCSIHVANHSTTIDAQTVPIKPDDAVPSDTTTIDAQRERPASTA